MNKLFQTSNCRRQSMSVATPTKTSSRPATKGSDRVAPDQLIATRIAEACRALWWAELVRTALGMVVIATSAVLIWSVIDQWIYSPGRLIRSLAFCGLLGFWDRTSTEDSDP